MAIDAVMAEMHRIDQLMSPFKPESELSLVNREAARRAVPVCPEMFELVERSLDPSDVPASERQARAILDFIARTQR